MSALDPDLENDDFFVRKTGAFHANPCVLRAFEDFRSFSGRDDPVERDIILQCREGELVLPDLEKDDMIVRRIPAPKKEVPLSGAPDRYQPIPFPEPWTLPPEIQAKFLCVLERTCPSKEQSNSCRVLVPSFRQKTDDMLTRKIQCWKLGTSVPPISFIPGPCSEADLQKWEAIREASRLRHRKRLMVERSECVSARTLLVPNGWSCVTFLVWESGILLPDCMSRAILKQPLNIYVALRNLCTFHGKSAIPYLHIAASPLRGPFKKVCTQSLALALRRDCGTILQHGVSWKCFLITFTDFYSCVHAFLKQPVCSLILYVSLFGVCGFCVKVSLKIWHCKFHLTCFWFFVFDLGFLDDKCVNF